jgi:hypothetical protein
MKTVFWLIVVIVVVGIITGAMGSDDSDYQGTVSTSVPNSCWDGCPDYDPYADQRVIENYVDQQLREQSSYDQGYQDALDEQGD